MDIVLLQRCPLQHLFHNVSEMLLNPSLIYSKSFKKTCELVDIAIDFKEVYEILKVEIFQSELRELDE